MKMSHKIIIAAVIVACFLSPILSIPLAEGQNDQPQIQQQQQEPVASEQQQLDQPQQQQQQQSDQPQQQQQQQQQPSEKKLEEPQPTNPAVVAQLNTAAEPEQLPQDLTQSVGQEASEKSDLETANTWWGGYGGWGGRGWGWGGGYYRPHYNYGYNNWGTPYYGGYGYGHGYGRGYGGWGWKYWG